MTHVINNQINNNALKTSTALFFKKFPFFFGKNLFLVNLNYPTVCICTDLTNATNKTTSVFIRLSDESPSSQKAPMNNHTDNQFHSSTVSASVNKPTETSSSSSSSSSSANENRANSSGNFHQENVNNRGSSSEVNGTSCDQKNGSLACDNNNRNSSNRGEIKYLLQMICVEIVTFLFLFWEFFCPSSH